MNLDEKIELYFFDPGKSKDEYIQYYQKVNPERCKKEKSYRYSPLYLLLRDIRYCFGIGKMFNSKRDKEFGAAYFAGILLIHLGFKNIVKKLFSGNFPDFAKKYMNITDSENVKALDKLRNALSHYGYSLYVYSEKTGEKIYFSLSFDYPFIIKKNSAWRRPYPSLMYQVNPKRLYRAFEKGIILFKEELLDNKNKKLRENFNNKIRIKNWIWIG